jgi:sulfite reductase beta subunit-like hemoprotein
MLDRLRAVGLSTTEACGDCVRNILNCPVSGVDREELFDATPLVDEVNAFFVGNREFSNLPRKFKIAITGCSLQCVYPEINDIGMFAVRDSRGEVALRTRVGGGLSTTPRFSKDLGVLVAPEEALDVCAAIAAVFRDEGNRGNRKKARLKFLVESWEIPRFRAEVERRLGRQLRSADGPAEPVRTRDRTHLGILPQREPGLFYAGVALVGGRSSGRELARLADLAETHGSGRIRTTNTQDVVLLDVPEDQVPALERDLVGIGLRPKPSWAMKNVIACTGIQFCKLAVAETKTHADKLVEYLDREVRLDEPVRISVTGCPNSCGQHHICDIGLEGAVVRIDGQKVEAFQVFLGGGVGERETFGRRIGVRIPSYDLGPALASLLRYYKESRQAGESFQAFCARTPDDELASNLRLAEATHS